MSLKKQALGRGLDALISPVQASSVSDTSRKILEIPISDIQPNINQPRTHFNDEDIVDLANSIREKGILQPILVRKQLGRYEIIAGERRFRASQSLGSKTVPCIVVDVSDQESFVLALIENLQRENLNAMEEAKAFQSLIEQFSLTQDEVAARVGKNRSTVANSLRLMNLPLDIQDDVVEGRLSAGHARAILQVPDAPKQRHLRNLILAKGLSVREAEAQARSMTKEKPRTPPKPVTTDAHMRSLQEEFSMKMGLPVFIKAITAQAGKVEIQYHSIDDFQTISDFFGVERQEIIFMPTVRQQKTLIRMKEGRYLSPSTLRLWPRFALVLAMLLGFSACNLAVTGGHAKEWLGVDIVGIIINSDLIGKICLGITFIFSFVSWAIIIYKFVHVLAAGRQTNRFLKECMSGTGNLEEAYAKAGDYPDSPLAQILREAYLELEIEDWYNLGYNLSDEQRVDVAKSGVDRVLERTISNEIAHLESNLIFLALTANVCPFFGLFGTVWGIMGTFQGMGAQGGAALSALAPGIATALTTTVGGLAAAIPASIFYNYFTGKVQAMISRMDSFSLELSNILTKQLLKREVK